GTGKDLSGRGHSFQGAVEWLPFNERFGTIGLGVGFGLYQSGKIVTISKDAPTEAERKIHRLGDGETGSRSNNLVTIPLGTYVSYHGRFVPGQIVVPFVRFGPSMTIARQISRS